MIGQVWARLQLMVAKGIGVLIGDARIQATVFSDEPLNNIERVEPYGFSYRPKPGCQPYLLFPSGDRTYGIALVIGDSRYQMTLAEGEVALHDDEGNHVHLKRGGVIEAKASTKVLADTPLFETTQDALVGGNLVVKGQTNSTGGFYGENGSVAACHGGLDVLTTFTVNGKNVSESHTHTTTTSGQPTSGVN